MVQLGRKDEWTIYREEAVMIEGKGLSAIRNSNINSSFSRESEAKDIPIFSKM